MGSLFRRFKRNSPAAPASCAHCAVLLGFLSEHKVDELLDLAGMAMDAADGAAGALESTRAGQGPSTEDERLAFAADAARTRGLIAEFRTLLAHRRAEWKAANETVLRHLLK